jgi:hypothetical protein
MAGASLLYSSGWGQHMICNKKYHFLLPSKETGAAYLNCEANGAGPPNDKDSNLVESQGHLMHGVFHSNGFGHLLRVNGVEMGSDLAGHHILDFWDRLCIGLRARWISAYFVSSHFFKTLVMNLTFTTMFCRFKSELIMLFTVCLDL